jgi:hypothetical protein
MKQEAEEVGWKLFFTSGARQRIWRPMIFVKMMFLPMLLKVLDKTQRPFTCAFIYALGLFTNGMIFDVALSGGWIHNALLPFAQALVESAIYFYLLAQLDGSAYYWLVLAVGGLLLMIY